MAILERLSANTDTELNLVVQDDWLNRALDPFRGVGPLSAHCGLEGCNRAISWWALPIRGRTPWPASASGREVAATGFVYGNALKPTEGARLVHSSLGPRRAEVRVKAVGSVDTWHPDPFRDWSVGVVAHPHDAEPLDEAGLRLRFTCQRKGCGEPYLLSNGQMLAYFVTAVAASHSEIRLRPQGTRDRL